MNIPKIGECKELIDILVVGAPYAIDGSGAIKSVYAAGVRAKIEPLGGNVEELTQQAHVSTQNYRVWIWRRPGVAAFHQIKWGTKRLLITAPPEKITDYWMLINCREVIARNL